MGVSMSTRFRVCSTPGCPTVHNNAGSRCDIHESSAKRSHWDRTKAYNTKGHRIRFRAAVLRRDPICVLCQVRESREADHHPRSRTELIELGLDPNDPQYGRGLCTPCHSKETALHQPGGWNSST
jgi:5-methylcytosine-specific restriction protein A